MALNATSECVLNTEVSNLIQTPNICCGCNPERKVTSSSNGTQSSHNGHRWESHAGFAKRRRAFFPTWLRPKCESGAHPSPRMINRVAFPSSSSSAKMHLPSNTHITTGARLPLSMWPVGILWDENSSNKRRVFRQPLSPSLNPPETIIGSKWVPFGQTFSPPEKKNEKSTFRNKHLFKMIGAYYPFIYFGSGGGDGIRHQVPQETPKAL